jgi:hypothetical protein
MSKIKILSNLKKILKLRNILIVFLIILTLGGIGSGAYFYLKYKDATKTNQSAEQTAKEVSDLVEEISKIMKLPEGETPTLATVLEKDKLQDQEFFKNAENGDKVLVYMTAKKAILYRPSERKIIEVSPVNMDSTTTTTKAE